MHISDFMELYRRAMRQRTNLEILAGLEVPGKTISLFMASMGVTAFLCARDGDEVLIIAEISEANGLERLQNLPTSIGLPLDDKGRIQIRGIDREQNDNPAPEVPTAKDAALPVEVKIEKIVLPPAKIEF